MRIRKFGTVAAALMVCALTSAAQAGECKRIAAAGDGPNKDIAIIMSTHGLQNIIDGRGMKGSGPVKTTCKDGTILTECFSSQTACK